jgi:hypothetical protein
MNNCTIFIGIFLFLLSLEGSSQNGFPESWEGNYEGELQIFGVDSVQMKLTMKLDVLKKTDSIYQWKISYDVFDKEDIRDYELVLVDRKKGIFKIDEKNTIMIDSYYRMGLFTSFFEVNNAIIISSYTKSHDGILFELIASKSNNPTITGDAKFNNEDIPPVKSYLVNGRQRALLLKQ